MSQKQNKRNKEQESAQKKLTQKQKSWIYTGAFFLIVLFLFIINNINGDVPEQGPLPPNYTDNSAETLKLSDLRGKIVIIDFWATWCPPCRRGIPDFIGLKNEMKNKDFEIIGISLDSFTRGGQTKNDVIPFMKKMGINYPIVEGNVQTTQMYGGIRSIPTAFVIDPEGQVVAQHVGLVPIEEYKKDIEAIHNGTAKKYGSAPDFTLRVIKEK